MKTGSILLAAVLLMAPPATAQSDSERERLEEQAEKEYEALKSQYLANEALTKKLHEDSKGDPRFADQMRKVMQARARAKADWEEYERAAFARRENYKKWKASKDSNLTVTYDVTDEVLNALRKEGMSDADIATAATKTTRGAAARARISKKAAEMGYKVSFR